MQQVRPFLVAAQANHARSLPKMPLGLLATKGGKVTYLTFEERFWRKVNKNGPVPPHRPELGPCHIWTAYCDPAGYGRFARASGENMMMSHRVLWEMVHGPIPNGQKVLHKCDVRSCVNPSHLFLGTQAQNVADCVSKKRHARGPGAGLSKLSWGQVKEIRSLYAQGVKQSELCKIFSLASSKMCMVVSNRSYINP